MTHTKPQKQRRHNVLRATTSARTRLLNARPETALFGVRDHRARREVPGGHQRQWVRGTGPCRAAEQLRAKHPDVSHNPSGSPAGYFPACKISDSEAAKQPPAARALQPPPSPPPPLPEPPADALHGAASAAGVALCPVTSLLLSIVLQNNARREGEPGLAATDSPARNYLLFKTLTGYSGAFR